MTIDRDDLRREDEVFAGRVGQRLRDGADELDAATLSRLNRARQVALDNLDKASDGKYGRSPWLPAGAAAGIAVLIAVIWLGRSLDTDTGNAPVTADEMPDLELLLDDGDLEMYAELEFFAWLPEDDEGDSG